jgi:hypothetical protein
MSESDYYGYRLHERDIAALQQKQTTSTAGADFSVTEKTIVNNQENQTGPHYFFRPQAIHCGCRLFQEYLLDGYTKMEASRLLYQRMNQKQLRAECYGGLSDAITAGDAATVGHRVVLAPTFIGGPREMNAAYQDSMAMVRAHSKPHFFITATANPKWPEITAALRPTQTAVDRPDIVVRVFRMKLKALIDDLYERGIYGFTVAFAYAIEYQKRGLPHGHILLILDQGINPDHVDEYVSAEIPDPVTQPELYKIVTSCMVHSPCGTANPHSPCMNEGACEKGYPKEFAAETTIPVDGMPKYRRRSPADGGRTFTKRMRDNAGNFTSVEIDNRWVVPYNPYLSKTYNCHINVESCHSVQCVKYIYKYVFKGHDCATMNFKENADNPAYRQNVDEITNFVSGRYVSSTEGFSRLFHYATHKRYPPVEALAVHLENMQRVYWADTNDDAENASLAIIAAACPTSTTLTAWFQRNIHYSNATRNLEPGEVDSRTLLYAQMPTHFTYNTSVKEWVRRKQGCNRRRIRLGTDQEDFSSDTIGRLHTVSPKDLECYYFRTLLCHVKGAFHWRDVRTYSGVEYATFAAACRARGLLADDDEWRACLDEAKATQFPSQLRSLFTIIVLQCEPSDPLALWNEYKEDLSEDILHRHRRDFSDVTIQYNEDVENETLLEIQHQLGAANKTMEEMHLPTPTPMAPAQNATCRTIADEMALSNTPEKRAAQARECDGIVAMMRTNNTVQLALFNEITTSVNQGQGGAAFFVDAPAGTGKTTLCKAILAYVRKDGDIALAVASSGIAATLMPLGRTAHSRLRLLFKVLSTSFCKFTQQVSDETRAVLAAAKVLIWDEAPMTHRHQYEALNRTLQFALRNGEQWGGLTIVFLGDFRQVLPVVPQGRRFQIVDASLKKSTLWRTIEHRRLTMNMRVLMSGGHDRDELQTFADFLLRVGNGTEPVVPELGNEFIKIPDNMCLENPTIENLIAHVYDDLTARCDDALWLGSRTILCAKNDDVDNLNDLITDRFKPEAHMYELLSADEVGPDDNDSIYPIEFLNSLTVSGLPPHKLRLKLGMIVMCLRNMDQPKGDCNGSRYVVRRISSRLLDLEHLSPDGPTGRHIFVPRVTLTTDDNFPFVLRRRQFPVRPAFAMTINKAQGQTLKRVGLYLPKPVFSHGQLYVAMSRVGKRDDIKFCIVPVLKAETLGLQGHYTQNIVYKEVLL